MKKPPRSKGGKDDIAAPVQSEEETLKKMMKQKSKQIKSKNIKKN